MEFRREERLACHGEASRDLLLKRGICGGHDCCLFQRIESSALRVHRIPEQRDRRLDKRPGPFPETPTTFWTPEVRDRSTTNHDQRNPRRHLESLGSPLAACDKSNPRGRDRERCTDELRIRAGDIAS
jgi:hypothetical protein